MIFFLVLISLKMVNCQSNCTCHQVLSRHSEPYVRYYLVNKQKNLTDDQELINMAVFTVSDFIRIINAYIDQIGGIGDMLFRSHVNNVTNNIKLVSAREDLLL